MLLGYSKTLYRAIEVKSSNPSFVQGLFILRRGILPVGGGDGVPSLLAR